MMLTGPHQSSATYRSPSQDRAGSGGATRMKKITVKQQNAVLKRLRPIKSRERPYENRLRRYIEANYPVFFVKAKPTRKSFPDRVATGYGNIRLVELKRKGEDLDDAQVIMHRALLRQGIRVVRVHTGMSLDLAAKLIVNALRAGDWTRYA
jgi:hypothetical protein